MFLLSTVHVISLCCVFHLHSDSCNLLAFFLPSALAHSPLYFACLAAHDPSFRHPSRANLILSHFISHSHSFSLLITHSDSTQSRSHYLLHASQIETTQTENINNNSHDDHRHCTFATSSDSTSSFVVLPYFMSVCRLVTIRRASQCPTRRHSTMHHASTTTTIIICHRTRRLRRVHHAPHSPCHFA